MVLAARSRLKSHHYGGGGVVLAAFVAASARLLAAAVLARTGPDFAAAPSVAASKAGAAPREIAQVASGAGQSVWERCFLMGGSETESAIGKKVAWARSGGARKPKEEGTGRSVFFDVVDNKNVRFWKKTGCPWYYSS